MRFSTKNLKLMCRDTVYFLIFLSDGSEEVLTEEKSEPGRGKPID